VYLTSIKQNGQIVSVIGVAQTNERVSEFLRNTLYNSPWLERPELVEIKASTVTAATKDQRRCRVSIACRSSACSRRRGDPGVGPGQARRGHRQGFVRTHGQSFEFQLDVAGAVEKAASQFRASTPAERANGPLPKIAAYLAAMLLVLWPGWFLVVSDRRRSAAGRARPRTGAQSDFRSKLGQGRQPGELRKQKLHGRGDVSSSRSSAGKAEMDALLSDINQPASGAAAVRAVPARRWR